MIDYAILKSGLAYQELGSDYFDRLHPERTIRKLTERLQRLGVHVVITPSQPLTPRSSGN